MFFNDRNAIMYIRGGVGRNSDIEEKIRRCKLMQFCYHGYLDPNGLLDVALVRHESRGNFVFRLFTLIDHAEEEKRLTDSTVVLIARATNTS